jgi:hypothetical protein
VAIDSTAPRSRRAILAGALGGAGALIAHSLGRATPVAAANGEPVTLGQGTTITQNVATLPTVINSDAAPAFGTLGDSNVGIQAQVTGNGVGLRAVSVGGSGADATSTTGAGLIGNSLGPAIGGRSTGVIGHTGDGSNLAPITDETGVYGFSDETPGSVGVWGDSLQGVGVVATGDWGFYGTGNVGAVGDVGSASTGVYGFAGDEEIATPTPGAGVLGRAGAGANYGVVAAAAASNQFALYVAGRLRLNGAGGRTSFTSTATSKKITMAGVTTASFIVATIQTSISGCYVRAVVPAAGSFTIYLSKAPGKTAVVGYIVAN